MSKASARYIGKCFGMDANWTYEVWEDMGLIVKNKFGDWILTEAGKKIGGSTSKRYGVPIFKGEEIVPMMNEFLRKVFGKI